MNSTDHQAGIVARLVAAGCVAADEEATAFIAAAPDAATLDEWIHRRAQGEPPAWIIGATEFCGRKLHVVPGVYVPRPRTEDLARRAAALLPRAGRALDLCTGTGAIARHLADHVPDAWVIGVDVDHRAAACARRNGVATLVGDLADAVRGHHVFDVVTAVPPYVPTDAIRLLPADVRRHEPVVALDGGADGLDIARHVIAAAGRLLRPGGSVVMEIGGSQDELLATDLASAGFGAVEAWCDEDGDLRGIVAVRA